MLGSIANHPKVSRYFLFYSIYQFIKGHWTVKTCAHLKNSKMFEKLFSKLRIGIGMSSSHVDSTADKKLTSSSSKASEVGK